jgi:hypothetical protein
MIPRAIAARRALTRNPTGFTQVVIPEAGLPEIFDFVGKPSYPGPSLHAFRHRLGPGSQGSQTESP